MGRSSLVAELQNLQRMSGSAAPIVGFNIDITKAHIIATGLRRGHFAEACFTVTVVWLRSSPFPAVLEAWRR